MSNSLNHEELLLLDKLLAELGAGDLSPEDAVQLKKLVLNNPSALWRYTQATQLIAGLWWERGGVAHSLTEPIRSDAVQDNSERRALLSSFPPVRGTMNFYSRHLWLSRAAALLIVGTSALWATGVIHPFGPKQVRVVDVPSHTSKRVAQVVSISPDCQWAADKG